VWTRVASAAARDGWVASNELLAIADRRIPPPRPEPVSHD